MEKREPLLNGHSMLLEEGLFPLSCDTVLLSEFVRARPKDRVLDLGTGCGALGLLLMIRNEGIRVDGVELDARAAMLAQKNWEENGFIGRGNVWPGDYCTLPKECLQRYDICAANPPYFEAGTGKVSVDPSRAQSRSGGEESLKRLCRSAGQALKTHGTLNLCYPAAQLGKLMIVLHDCNFAAKRLRFVHHSPEKEAFLVLLEARLGGGAGCCVCPPLFIKINGEDSAGYRGIYSGE